MRNSAAEIMTLQMEERNHFKPDVYKRPATAASGTAIMQPKYFLQFV